MEQNNLHLTIDLNLNMETLQKNNITLERILDWVRIREDAVVCDFTIRVDAPEDCITEDCFHLPDGFYAAIQDATSPEENLTRKNYEITRQGNPFRYVTGVEDLSLLVQFLLKHTHQKPTTPDPEPFWVELLESTEYILMHACCLFLLTECPEEDHCLCCLLKMLQSGCDSSDDASELPLSDYCVLNCLFDAVAERDPNNCCVSAYSIAKTHAGIAVAREALLSCIYRIERMTLSQLNFIINDLQMSTSPQKATVS